MQCSVLLTLQNQKITLTTCNWLKLKILQGGHQRHHQLQIMQLAEARDKGKPISRISLVCKQTFSN